MAFEKIVIVTRKTRMEDLILRFNTRAQAKFYIEHAGADFADYEREDATYRQALDKVRGQLDVGLKVQVIDRELTPTFLFSPQDLVVTLGQDGLVANTAKYVGAQPIVAVNPDAARFDGVLLPFAPDKARAAVLAVVKGVYRARAVTLAEVALADGQRLYAFNDLFIGARSHVSARYRIGWRGKSESHSSSGVVISTGAGSTGWLSSIFNMARGVLALASDNAAALLQPRVSWEDPRLFFVVREPFRSRHSGTGVIAGVLEPDEALRLESAMPTGGVIFSDGVEADYLAFNSGAVANIRAATQKAHLVVPG
jgi:NAD kinase